MLTAVRPVGLAADAERCDDRGEADEARLELPPEIEEPAGDVPVAEHEVCIGAVRDTARHDGRRDEPAGQRAPPRRDERRRRDRAQDDETENRVADGDDRGQVEAERQVVEHEPPPEQSQRRDHEQSVEERLTADHAQRRPEDEDEGRQHPGVEAEVADIAPPRERNRSGPELGHAPEHLAREPRRARQ